MLFNSFTFWVFFVVVFAFYRILPHKGQNLLLLVSSYFFYGYWDYRFLSLIFISTVADFLIAKRIDNQYGDRSRKALVGLSITINLGLLATFKYYGFFADQLNELLQLIGLHDYLPIWQIVLPVGISFYTFQTISYTVDVYKRKTKPAKNFLDFALYVSFFPQLVAGPIERSSHLLPQILKPRTITVEDIRIGLYLILYGLFKKIIIADNMAVIVNHVFSQSTAALSGTDLLLGVYAFAFQIYGDFSGYSTIAIGLARLMGIDLMWNFRMPYHARSPSEFWQRWHISLSSWLRDYLYIPLGGNRNGNYKTFRNLALTMLLGGLWHGANWTYIVWGAYHGFLLIAYRIFPWLGESSSINTGARTASSVGNIVRVILFFNLVSLGWIFFRAEHIAQAMEIISKIAISQGLTDFSWYAIAYLTIFAVPMIVYEIWLEAKKNQLALVNSHWIPQGVIYAYMLIMLMSFAPLVPQVFIYFQF